MVAIVGGLGSAMSWAIATLASSRSSRMIGPMSVLGWVMAVGWLAAIGPALLAQPITLDLPLVAGVIGIGLSHNAGLLLAYRALTIGRVSIVAPIVATEGALAAVLSFVLGETLGLSTAVLLGVMAVGVVLAASERSADRPETTTHDPAQNRRAVLLAIAAALSFSIGLVLSGRLGAAEVPPAWVMLGSRTVGLFLIVLPLVVTRRFQLTRRAVPLVVLAGILEVLGGAIFVVAATADIAIAAVMSSQFAAIAAVGGYLLFKERLQRLQIVGVIIVAVGITALAVSQA